MRPQRKLNCNALTRLWGMLNFVSWLRHLRICEKGMKNDSMMVVLPGVQGTMLHAITCSTQPYACSRKWQHTKWRGTNYTLKPKSRHWQHSTGGNEFQTILMVYDIPWFHLMITLDSNKTHSILQRCVPARKTAFNHKYILGAWWISYL